MAEVPTNGPQAPPQALQDFVDCRGRPALFFVSDESLWRRDVIALGDLLAEGDYKFEELDLVIHSGGGSAHAAFQFIQLVRMHSERVNACVPFWAKSAATLLCIGADKIVLGEHAELGPLDVQMYEEKKAGKGEYGSALNPFKTLEQLQQFSVESLSTAMGFIVERYDMSYDEALRHAMAFVEATTGPLISRLDPEKLGAYSRELSVANDYAQRLLRRYSDWDHRLIDETVQQLIYGYPSHEYIIDAQELEDLGFAVEIFTPEEAKPAIKGLLPVVTSGKSILTLLEPKVEPGSVEAELAGITENAIDVAAGGAGPPEPGTEVET